MRLIGRLNRDQLEVVKNRFNVDKIWSYSQISTYDEHPWIWYLRYIKRVRDVEDTNIYSLFGKAVHDIMEDYIGGEIKQEDMADRFEDIVADWQMNHSDLTFPTDNSRDNYLENLRHYFKYTEYDFSEKLEDGSDRWDVSIEKPVITVYDGSEGQNVVFIGYIDLLLHDKQEDKWYVCDFKTSAKSSFSGKKLNTSSRQLRLYAEGIHQMYNIPYENILLRYDMQKYVTVSFLQKNGKWSKATLKDRNKWVLDYSNRILSALEDMDIDFIEGEELINEAMRTESLKHMPQEIQDKFKVGQGFIDIQMTQELAETLEHWLVNKAEEAEKRSQSEDLEAEFPEPNLDVGDNFYYNFLAKGYLKYHKGHQEKEKLKELAQEELDIGSMDEDELNDLFR